MTKEDEVLVKLAKCIARDIFGKLWGKSMSDVNFTEIAYPEIYCALKKERERNLHDKRG